MTIPAMKWCGVEHPHHPHQWVVSSGQTGTYASCPGSSGRKSVGACAHQPYVAGQGFVSPSHCTLAAGHAGAHEDGEGGMWFETSQGVEWEACGRGICANRARHPGRCTY